MQGDVVQVTRKVLPSVKKILPSMLYNNENPVFIALKATHSMKRRKGELIEIEP